MTDIDLATDICMISIDKIIYLRTQIKEALTARCPDAARDILQAALDATDVGTMKVWQPGEEPF